MINKNTPEIRKHPCVLHTYYFYHGITKMSKNIYLYLFNYTILPFGLAHLNIAKAIS